ncbi:MAG: cytidine deaminase [Acidobacteriota bacterium]
MKRKTPAASQRERLCRAALDARLRAHAPYSGFLVGAALLAADGEIITGCNIENASYGLTVCAERVAVWKAVSEGKKKFKAIAVASETAGTPCGACRQILWEFCGDIPVYVVDTQDHIETYRVSELMPYPFDERKLT